MSEAAGAADPSSGAEHHASPSSLSVTLLGTGTSTGVPVIGCDCDVCTSTDPRDTRTRCSCYIEAGPMGVLIDTSPDFREQALREEIDRIDAVCYTHHHFDHVVGIDDLRPFFFENARAIPCYAPTETADVLGRNYDYLFGDNPYPGAANVELQRVDGPFRISSRYDEDVSVPVEPIPLDHGEMRVYGYRIGRLAYLTDTSGIPDASFELLEGVDVLVLDALRERPHPTHFSFDEAIATARRIGARETYFVHMTHTVRHAEVDARLPDGVNLAYDGLRVEC